MAAPMISPAAWCCVLPCRRSNLRLSDNPSLGGTIPNTLSLLTNLVSLELRYGAGEVHGQPLWWQLVTVRVDTIPPSPPPRHDVRLLLWSNPLQVQLPHRHHPRGSVRAEESGAVHAGRQLPDGLPPCHGPVLKAAVSAPGSMPTVPHPHSRSAHYGLPVCLVALPPHHLPSLPPAPYRRGQATVHDVEPAVRHHSHGLVRRYKAQ